MGIENPYLMPPAEMHHIIVGWMLDGRPVETDRDDDGKVRQLGRTDLLAMLEGEQTADGETFNHEAIAQAYAEGADPMAPEGTVNSLTIQMREELRRAGSDKAKRAAIRVKYDRLAREARQAQEAQRG